MLALGPKKDGGPNAKFFDSAEILAQLDGVKQWLLKNCKKVCTYSRRRIHWEIFCICFTMILIFFSFFSLLFFIIYNRTSIWIFCLIFLYLRFEIYKFRCNTFLCAYAHALTHTSHSFI